MDAEQALCPMCGEWGRLRCADCGRAFCVEHVERHFAMGYFYLCADCAAKRAAEEAASDQRKAPRRRRR
jgi:hypothetical protein